MAYTNTWDGSFEGTPSDTENISQGASRIRDLKLAIRERMQKDHYWDPDGTDEDHGEHKWVTLREQSTKPSVSTGKHAVYARSDGVYIEKEDGTEIKIFDFANEQLVNGDIPSGEIILFEKDTAVVGYTLLTDKDDMVIYVTKGSGAGGETGATDKSGGTWTQPNHTHATPNHWHDLPFGWPDGDWGFFADHDQRIGRTINMERGYGLDASGNWAAPSYRTYGDDGGGTTSGSTTPDTWRPPGRNFTRQQRN